VVRVELLGGVERRRTRGLRDDFHHVAIGGMNQDPDGIGHTRKRLSRRRLLQAGQLPRTNQRLRRPGRALRGQIRRRLRET
jgi:hypothetical protein